MYHAIATLQPTGEPNQIVWDDSVLGSAARHGPRRCRRSPGRMSRRRLYERRPITLATRWQVSLVADIMADTRHSFRPCSGYSPTHTRRFMRNFTSAWSRISAAETGFGAGGNASNGM